MFKVIRKHWQTTCTIIICVFLCIWAYGCQPTVPSMTDPSRRVTRAELQLELEQLQSLFEIRNKSLEDQEQLRQLVMQNVLLIAQTGTINPLGLITAVLGFYGAVSATRDTKNLVKKKLTKKSYD